jgi:hypothetical protein
MKQQRRLVGDARLAVLDVRNTVQNVLGRAVQRLIDAPL